MVRAFVLYSEEPDQARYVEHRRVSAVVSTARLPSGLIFGSPVGAEVPLLTRRFEFPDRQSVDTASARRISKRPGRRDRNGVPSRCSSPMSLTATAGRARELASSGTSTRRTAAGNDPPQPPRVLNASISACCGACARVRGRELGRRKSLRELSRHGPRILRRRRPEGLG